MKKTIIFFVIFFLLLNSGCVSYYNHNRIAENIYRENILTHGTRRQKEMLNAGISSKAVIISGMANENEVSARVMFNFADFQGVKGYFKSYSEAPVSSSMSLAADIVGSYLIARYGTEEYKKAIGGNKNEYNITGDHNNITIYNSELRQDKTTNE